MSTTYPITKPAGSSINWDTVARYYTDLYYEYQKTGDTDGMKAAYEAGEAARTMLTTPSSSGTSANTVANVSSPSSGTAAISSPSPSYQSYDDYYYTTGFSDMESQAQSLYNAQIQNSVDALSRQKQSITQSADELARQAYISYLRSRETLPQQLAAMGYNGGLSESRQVALESGWQDRRNQIGIERDNALFAIDSAINDAYSQGQSALAEQLLSIRSQAQTQWNEYVRRQEEAALENYWKQSQMNYDLMTRQQDLLYQQSRDKVSDTRWETQFNYQQNQDKAQSEWDKLVFEYQKSQDTAKSEWDALLFEYQQKQDTLQNTIKQQQLLLQQMEAARKAASGK